MSETGLNGNAPSAVTSAERIGKVVDTRSSPQGEGNPRNRKVRTAWAFLALLLLAFSQSLLELTRYALGHELHSYIVLIPFISAYLINLKRRELPGDFQPCWTGALILLGLGLAALSAAWWYTGMGLSNNDRLSLTALSFVAYVAAGGFLFLGRKWMRAVAFPMALLAFMIPLPDQLVDSLETASKLGSAEVAHLFFQIAGVPNLREGALFQLPGIVIVVAQECSGIRSSLILFITSLIAANMFLQTNWRRVLLIAFVIPLGVIRNGFRILVIGWLCVNIGPHMIDSLIHHRGGPVFFALSLIPLFALLWWLRRGEMRKTARGVPVRTSETGGAAI